MQYVRKIGFTFENCEYFEIDGKYIGEFCLEDIETKIQRVAINAINKYQVVNTVLIELFSEGNEECRRFTTKETKFDRIMAWNDITHIDVFYEDDTEDSYAVNYEEEEDALGAPNTLQTTYLSKPGNLYIAIGKDLKDMIDMDIIEDDNDMKSIKRLYGVYDDED